MLSALYRTIRRKMRDRAFVLLLAALVPVGSAAGFVVLAEEVNEGETLSVDNAILLAMREPGDPGDPRGPAWVESMGRDLTALGSTVVIVFITAAIGGGLLLLRNYQAVLFMLIAVGGGQAISSLLKFGFNRPRPDLVPHAVDVYTASFPSGHSMLSAIIYLTLAALLSRLTKSAALRLYIVAAAMVLTVLVGISRVYLGVHYPSDVLAGWAAGLAWAATCWLVAAILQQRGLGKADGQPARLTIV